jgi:DNA polymerase-3 subunit delta'
MIPPRENPNLTGHEAAEAAILTAIASGRLPHAWLLLGPRGIGKATLAFRFARYLLANPDAAVDGGPGLFGDAAPEEPPSSLYLAPDHPVFRRTVSGGHTDLLVLDESSATGRTSQIPVEAVRGLSPFLHQTAGEGGRRIVVVDALDEINTAGANALLKLLEEPPAGAVLILVAHSLARVLPTIRSRCRLLRMPPLAPAGVQAVLEQQAPEANGDDLAQAAALSQGSPGQALALLEDDGLAIHQAMSAFWQQPARIRPDALSSLAQLGGQDAAHFQHFVTAFSAGLVQAARASGGGPDWDGLWTDTVHLCERTEAVYLDRRQVALNRLTAAAKLG